MKETTSLEQYYNKFNEEKRLATRHGIVEFETSMRYIHKFIGDKKVKILDVGAGTGRYTVALANEGHDVTAVELVQKNVGMIKSKNSSAKVFKGNATKLKRFDNDSFDIVLVFGPMYHLMDKEDRIKALSEAKRVVKPDGFIFVAYFMTDYRILRYGFKEGNILESMKKGLIDEAFLDARDEDNLYYSVRLEEIDELNNEVGLIREKIIAADGAANYIRTDINRLSEEEFDLFLKYHFETCERMELMGASAHTVDILKK